MFGILCNLIDEGKKLLDRLHQWLDILDLVVVDLLLLFQSNKKILFLIKAFCFYLKSVKLTTSEAKAPTNKILKTTKNFMFELNLLNE